MQYEIAHEIAHENTSRECGGKKRDRREELAKAPSGGGGEETNEEDHTQRSARVAAGTALQDSVRRGE